MNTPPSRGSQAKDLCDQGGNIVGVKKTWDKNPGANPRENYYGNPFLQNRNDNVTKDRAIKAGK
jgi:hypothetical protein